MLKKFTTDRRLRTAWLLLLVYVPMMIAVSLHHHGEAEGAVVAASCQDCVHHVHHDGHLYSLQHSMHDCVLCQLQSMPYLSAAVLVLAAVYVHHYIIRKSACARCCWRANDVGLGRAPPYLAC